MTANQIAFAKLQEEERTNRVNEAIKQHQAQSQAVQAQAAQRQATAANTNATTNRLNHYIAQDNAQSQRASNWGSAVGGLAKAVSTVLTGIGALFG